MSENKANYSTNSTPPSSGGEPTDLLLALAWSQIETLMRRNEVKIYQDTATKRVAVIFVNTAFDYERGLVPTAEAK